MEKVDDYQGSAFLTSPRETFSTMPQIGRYFEACSRISVRRTIWMSPIDKKGIRTKHIQPNKAAHQAEKVRHADFPVLQDVGDDNHHPF
jgi:hypothetical protein